MSTLPAQVDEMGHALWHDLVNSGQDRFLLKGNLTEEILPISRSEGFHPCALNLQQLSGRADRLADWMEENVPEGVTVFAWPKRIQRRLRTSNPIERCDQQEVKRRTRTILVFPNEISLLRVASAILMEVDDRWISETNPYIRWEDEND